METLRAAPSAARLGIFALPDFRRLWLVGLMVFAVRWLEMLAMAVFTYQRTGSPFTVALLTMLRMLPMGLFGALMGAVAERLDRRRALIAVVASMMASSATLGLLAYAGRLAVWELAAASFFTGIGWATDNPVRRALIGEAVGSDRMSAAMALDVGSNTVSRILGPLLGGILLATLGIAGAFTLSVSCYLIAIVAALRVEPGAAAAGGAPASVLARMIEGLILVRRDRRLIATLAITVIYNLFGWPCTSMVPVIGQDSLHLGASGIGLLASMDGVGALCGAIAIARWATPRRFASIYIGGVMVYLIMLICFALSPRPQFAGAALLLSGLSSAGFSVMQATLVYLAAPAEMRSRIYGVLSVCIGVAPIGFFILGLLADAVGAPTATVASGTAGLVALLLTRRVWRDVATVA